MIPVKRFYNQQITVSNPATDFNNNDIYDESDNETIIGHAIDNDTVYSYTKSIETPRLIVKLMLHVKVIQMKGKALPRLLNKPLAIKNKKAYQAMSVGGVK